MKDEKFYQTLSDNPFYPRRSEFTRFEAWVDLLSVSSPDGVCPDSLGTLALRWKWTKSKVHRFTLKCKELGLLKKSGEGICISRPERYYEKVKRAEKWSTEILQEIIDCYNSVTERRVELTETHKKAIIKVLEEGKKLKVPYGLPQFKAVFEYKLQEWGGTDQERHLTIETICRHFSKYLEQARANHKRGIVNSGGYN